MKNRLEKNQTKLIWGVCLFHLLVRYHMDKFYAKFKCMTTDCFDIKRNMIYLDKTWKFWKLTWKFLKPNLKNLENQLEKNSTKLILWVCMHHQIDLETNGEITHATKSRSNTDAWQLTASISNRTWYICIKLEKFGN